MKARLAVYLHIMYKTEREGTMRKESVSLRIPEIGFIAGTRAALGVGLGLLLVACNSEYGTSSGR
jgi:hypothetical protein